MGTARPPGTPQVAHAVGPASGRTSPQEVAFPCQVHASNAESPLSPGTLPIPELRPREASPSGGLPRRLGSIVSLSLRSKFSLGGTLPFDSFTHSLKANKSNCFSKPRHAHHRAGHVVETAPICRWTPARRLQFTLARSRTNRAIYTAVVRLSFNSRDVGCHFRRIHTPEILSRYPKFFWYPNLEPYLRRY